MTAPARARADGVPGAGAPPAPGPLPRGLPWLLTLGGTLGLLAAFTLTVEGFALLTDPAYRPSCSINPVLSCGSVMSTPQAAVLGFPNAVLGVAGFALVLATGVGLLGGARFGGGYWAGLLAGSVAGTAFVHWLIGQSLYRIGAVCPYCMVVWSVTIPITWYVGLAAVDRVADRLPGPARSALGVVHRHHAVPVVLWFLALAGLVLHRFWGYWSTLL